MKVTLMIISLSIFYGLNLQNDKRLLLEDATYEEEIRTVQLYPDNNNPYDILEPAVTQLGRMNLILEFDDLVESHESYRAKIIHCNQDWTKSRLGNIDFLYEFNEFNINNYEYSVDTKIAYVHYTFRVPQVKLPGNYLLVVYRGNDENDIVLSKRFMVFANNISLQLTSPVTGFSSVSRFNQQLDFKINYKNYELVNPMESVKVTIRKNERWDNAVTNLRPSFIREDIQELEYRYFNFENSFKAGNEYRFFDMGSLRNPGANVQNVNWNTYPISVNLMWDKPRVYQAYSQFRDLNGDYVILNHDYGNASSYSDYVITNFVLQSDQPIPGNVYVVGKMNNWKLSNDNLMRYDNSKKVYKTDLILKQGRYDYQYYIKNDTLSSYYLEGDHFETENSYEIFVYYRPLQGLRADLLIGYGRYEINPRN